MIINLSSLHQASLFDIGSRQLSNCEVVGRRSLRSCNVQESNDTLQEVEENDIVNNEDSSVIDFLSTFTEHSETQFAKIPKTNGTAHQQLHPIFSSLTDQIVTGKQSSKVQESLQKFSIKIAKQMKRWEQWEWFPFQTLTTEKETPAGSPSAKK